MRAWATVSRFRRYRNYILLIFFGSKVPKIGDLLLMITLHKRFTNSVPRHHRGLDGDGGGTITTGVASREVYHLGKFAKLEKFQPI